MIRELYHVKIKEVALNVVQTKIESVRMKNITKSGCRVYDNGFIGIEGVLGEPTDETWENAIKNLEKQIPYPYEPSKNNKRDRNLVKTSITPDEFVMKAESVLEKLSNEFPQFIFSNKFKLTESEVLIKNDVGLDLIDRESIVEVALIVKHIESLNIFDTGVMFANRTFEEDKVLREARMQLEVFDKAAELPNKEKVRVILGFDDVSGKFIESLQGELLGREASIFSDKIGHKVFHDDFTLYASREEDTYTPFFDSEGTTLADDKIALIENGVILRGYTDKKYASEFNVENTSNAGGNHDDVPNLSYSLLHLKPSEKDLTELVGNDEAIFVVMMSGGDCTNEGDFASPVQMSYLYKEGKLVGKLPEFSLSGSIYELFGKDYVGYSKDKPIFNTHALVVDMKLS